MNRTGDMTSEEYRASLNLPEDQKGKSASLGRGNRNNNNNNGNNDSSNSGGRGRGGLTGRPTGRNLQDDGPRHINWFDEGKMHQIKDQGGCGSCWAFAANTVSEGTLAIRTNSEPIHISEQHLVDCTLSSSAGGNNTWDKDYGAWGCQGAWMEYAWEFQSDHGAMLESDYPYTSGTTGTETACAHDYDKTIGKI